MKLANYYKRVFYLPLAFIKGIWTITNEKARDIENKKRFPKVIIEPGSSFSKNVIIQKHSRICGECTINNSTIGSYTYINYKSLVQNTSIGNYCSISHNVILGLGQHPTNHFSTSPIFYKTKNALNVKLLDNDLAFEEYEEIIVGNDVWIGANTIVMDGITIGNGAIIAAGAVVTKNIPAYAIVGGVPAKIIKYRFDENKRVILENSEWWKLEPNEVPFIRN